VFQFLKLIKLNSFFEQTSVQEFVTLMTKILQLSKFETKLDIERLTRTQDDLRQLGSTYLEVVAKQNPAFYQAIVGEDLIEFRSQLDQQSKTRWCCFIWQQYDVYKLLSVLGW